LASVISLRSFLVVFFAESYTQIFYMIDEEGVLSIQCKMSVRGPKSMRKTNGLILILIDFYVPTLTPRLNSTDTSLQLSENLTPFAACRIYTSVISKET
jgi:hypothetical protein